MKLISSALILKNTSFFENHPSQAYTIAMEKMTDDRYIIGLAIENKLCWTAAWFTNRGFDVICPGGHAGCTANLPYLEPHSERRMAYSIAQDLSVEDFWIQTVTTDGDTKLYHGLNDFCSMPPGQ